MNRNSLNPMETVGLTMVLAVLSTVLFAGWQNANDAAELAKCRSNLHQLGAAVHRFADENGGTLPLRTDGFSPTTQWGTYIEDGRFFGQLVSGERGGRGVNDYLDGVEALFCPSVDDEVFAASGYYRPQDINEENRIVRMGYLYSIFVGREHSDNTTLFGDPHHPIAFDLGWAGFAVPFSMPSHQERLQVLHLGGHVTSLSRDEANENDNVIAFYNWKGDQSRNSQNNSH